MTAPDLAEMALTRRTTAAPIATPSRFSPMSTPEQCRPSIGIFVTSSTTAMTANTTTATAVCQLQILPTVSSIRIANTVYTTT